MKKTYTVCTYCMGTGDIELTGVYAETLSLVMQYPSRNGAQLAKIAGCKATAMNNRLKALEKKGQVKGRRHGRQIFWKQDKGE